MKFLSKTFWRQIFASPFMGASTVLILLLSQFKDTMIETNIWGIFFPFCIIAGFCFAAHTFFKTEQLNKPLKVLPLLGGWALCIYLVTTSLNRLMASTDILEIIGAHLLILLLVLWPFITEIFVEKSEDETLNDEDEMLLRADYRARVMLSYWAKVLELLKKEMEAFKEENIPFHLLEVLAKILQQDVVQDVVFFYQWQHDMLSAMIFHHLPKATATIDQQLSAVEATIADCLAYRISEPAMQLKGIAESFNLFTGTGERAYEALVLDVYNSNVSKKFAKQTFEIMKKKLNL